MFKKLKDLALNPTNRIESLSLLIIFLSLLGVVGKMFFWSLPGFIYALGESAIYWISFSVFLGSIGFVSNYGEIPEKKINVLDLILGDWKLPEWLSLALEMIFNIPVQIVKFFKAHIFTTRYLLLRLVALLFFGLISFGMWYLAANKPVVVASKDLVVKEPSQVNISLWAPSETSYEFKNGIVESNIDELTLNFDDSIVTAEEVGKTPAVGIRLTPQMSGSWKWVNSKRLVFTPQENWKIGQTYLIDVSKEIIPLSRKVNKRRFSFERAPFKGVVNGLNFYEDPTNPKLKKIVGEVSFNHPVNYDSLKTKINMYVIYKKRIKEANKGVEYIDERVDLDFELVKDPSTLKAYFHSKSVEIKSYSGNGFLQLSPGVFTMDSKVISESEGKSSVPVPSVYEYFNFDRPSIEIVDNENGTPEHFLIIRSSTPVAAIEIKKHLKIFQLQQRQGLRSIDDLLTSDFESADLIEAFATESPEEYPKQHSFKIKVEPKRKVYIELKEGIASLSGFKLDKFQRYLVTAPDYKKELKIIQSGSLLSRSGDKKISIMTRNIENMNLRIGQVLPEQIHHLISQSGGSYTDPSFNSYNFNKHNLAHFEKRKYKVSTGKEYQARYTVVDLSSYLNKRFKGLPARGLFFLEAESVGQGIRDRRLINITDLGIIVKKATDGSRSIFVQSLATGNPISGATVDVIGQNGLALISKRTNGQGMVELPKLYFSEQQRAIAFFVREGNDVSYMKIDDYSRKVNFSKFDIGGVSNYSMQGKLIAYAFNDRGTYRPGELVNLGFIIKDEGWIKNLEGVPVEIEVKNPKGQVLRTRSISLNSEGLVSQEFRLARSAPTGTYSANIYSVKPVGKRKSRSFLGSTNFSVQEFLPDTMKIKLEFSTPRYDGWISPEGLKANISLANLFGFPATERVIKSTLNLNPYRVSFPKYKDYRFTDPSFKDRSYTENLENLVTDSKGEASLDLELSKYDKGTFRINLTAEGFDAAEARSVVAAGSTIVSPEKYMIGRKADGEINYLSQDVIRTVNFIAVDSKLKKIALPKIKMQMASFKFVSVLTKMANGTYKYESVKKKEVLWKKDYPIKAEGRDYILPTDIPGDFRLSLHDENDREVSSIDYGVAGKRNLSRSLEKDAELEIGLNKLDFMPGETIEIELKAPYKGSGLITIEREKVFSHVWFEASTETSVHKIKVPRNLEGNAYINISFLRASDSEKIYMSPYSFGVKPFSVNSDKRKNNVSFDIPRLIKPGEELSIKYKSDKESKIIVYAVNEGILQLSNYRTPKPLTHFFKKRSLDVGTFQILDLLLPENSILKKTFAEGGGYAVGASKNLNPFGRKLRDPVAYWSKVVDSGPTWKTLKYKVPDYFNGSIRLMAVAVNNEAIGSEGQHITVRGDIIISPTVPTFITPGDEFLVSANFTNNIEASGDNAPILVKLEHSKNLEVLGGQTRTLKISERKDAQATFKVRALNNLGNSFVNFKASHKDKNAKYEETLSLRPSTQFHTTAWMSRLTKGTQKFNLDRATFEELAHKKLTISTIPFGLTNGIMSYLEKYPYGCTEQLVSKGFPYLVMNRRIDIKIDKTKIADFISLTVDMLVSRQAYSGGFGLYPGQEPERDFISLYAFHFLVEARNEGFRIQNGLFNKARKYVQQIAGNSSHLHEKAYAIYLLTKSGTVTTSYISNWEKLKDTMEAKVSYHQDLADAYIASSYLLLKQEKKALSMVSDLKVGSGGRAFYRYYSSVQRDGGLLYLLSNHFPDLALKLEAEALDKMVGEVRKGNYNSLSSSFAILGIDAYSRLFKKEDLEKLKIFAHTMIEGKKDRRPLDITNGKISELELDLSLTGLEVEYQGEKPLYISLSHAGFDKSRKDSEIQSNMIIKKEFQNIDGNKITKIKIGEEGIVELDIKSLGSSYSDVAIVDLLPGGFDLVIDNSKTGAAGLNVSVKGTTLETDYIDAREDRVILYSNISPVSRKFRFKVKAVSEGKFTFPGAAAEGMYNTDLKYVGKEFSVTVLGAN